MFPTTAYAAPAQPQGFEDFYPIYQQNFIQELIDVNKTGILWVEQLLAHSGTPLGQAAGYSIFIWAALLKVFTYPLYESSIKDPI